MGKLVTSSKGAEEAAVVPVKSVRPYSVIVWGATGFTGQLVCQHIANQYAGQVNWAMGGRSKEKLLELRKQLTEINPKCADVPILTAELNDPKSLDRLVKQGDVLISTAGPFWSIGTPVVDASLRTGTHYCDIAGEVHWMRMTTRKMHEAAKTKNIKIVHSCGFDSVPSDLGAYLLTQHMANELGRPCARIDMLVNEVKGGFSGGSLQSMFEHYTQPQEEIEHCLNPYCLNPGAEYQGVKKQITTAEVSRDSKDGKVQDPAPKEKNKDEQDQFGPRINSKLNCWTYPFQFAPINCRVVRRSNALWDVAYGSNFRYSEAHAAEGPVDAILGSMGHQCVHLITTVPLLRSLVMPLLPKPGDGPPLAYRKKNHWKFTLVGWTQEEGRKKGVQCQAVVSGRRDPGYWETSRLVLESALCLATQGADLKEAGYLQGGVLTPATAMGHILIERLRAANVIFEITKTGKEKKETPLDAMKAVKKGSSSTIGGAVSGNSLWSGPSVASCTAACMSAAHTNSVTNTFVPRDGDTVTGTSGATPEGEGDCVRFIPSVPGEFMGGRRSIGLHMNHAHPALLAMQTVCAKPLLSSVGGAQSFKRRANATVWQAWKRAGLVHRCVQSSVSECVNVCKSRAVSAHHQVAHSPVGDVVQNLSYKLRVGADVATRVHLELADALSLPR